MGSVPSLNSDLENSGESGKKRDPSTSLRMKAGVPPSLFGMFENIFQGRMWRKIHRGMYFRRTRLRLFSILATGFLVLVVGGFLFATLLFAWYAKDLPRPGKLTAREIALSTKIFDRNGELLYDVYGEKNRTWVPLSTIPRYLSLGTIAIEDKDFYKHQGFDPKGILRSIRQIILFHNLQGGSTLTQQLIKNTLLSTERTLPRKIKEFILAVQVERKYSKDQILELYLNESPYGGTAWGVEAAAETYFGKKVRDLNLVESALLAGLPQKPSSYSPFGSDPKAYIWRSEQVLRRLKEDGYITAAEEERAKDELPNLKFAPQGEGIKAAHFVMYVKEILVEQFGEKTVEQGGLQVTTTLDYKLQEKAEKIVKEEVEKMKSYKVGNGAAVVLDPRSGEILSMVGSKDYFAKDYDGNVNVVMSLRQPGSAIKPITYATAFKKGYTAATVLLDIETHFPGGADEKDYIPKNYDGKFRGPVQARFALANSINVAAVKMLAQVGVRDMLSLAYDMGLSTLEPTNANMRRFGLAITLGGGEVRLLDLTSAFGVFGNSGVRLDPVSILKVTDSKGKELFEYKKGDGKKVLSPEVSFLISHILLDNEARSAVFGTRSYLVIPGKTVSVKTGTTDDKRDNWTVGFTPSRVVGVWTGNNDNSKMSPYVESGSTGAAPIWNKIMRETLSKIPNQDPKKPDGVVALEIDAFLGGLPKEGYPKRTEYFIRGTEPQEMSPFYKKIKISKATGKLANPAEIASGDYDEKDFVVFDERDPVSTDGKNRWQEAWTNFANTVSLYKDDQKYHPPTETSDAKSNDVVVRIQSPLDHAQVNDRDVEVDVKATSMKEIIKMTIEVDGSEKKSLTVNSFKERINMSDGPHSIKVKAWDGGGNEGSAEVRIGVNTPWDFVSPTPVPPTTAPTSTPVPTVIPTLTP